MHRHLVLGLSIAFAVLTVATFASVPTLRHRLLAVTVGGGPIQTANGALSLDLPLGWRSKQLTGSTAQLQAVDASKSAYVTVGVVAKADLAVADLKPWADRCMAIANGRSRLQGRVNDSVTTLTVAGRTAYQCRVTGTLTNGTRVVYVKTYLETPKHLCEVLCWTTPSNETVAQPDFDAIVNGITDVPGH